MVSLDTLQMDIVRMTLDADIAKNFDMEPAANEAVEDVANLKFIHDVLL